MNRSCSHPSCKRSHYSLGYCRRHYYRLRKGLPLETPLVQRGESVADRFWTKVDTAGQGGCWNWTGSLSGSGYAQIRTGPPDRRLITVHRFSYELLVGPIPDGMQLDHLCRNRACCNPDHLEPVTGAENMRRARAAKKVQTDGEPVQVSIQPRCCP